MIRFGWVGFKVCYLRVLWIFACLWVLGVSVGFGVLAGYVCWVLAVQLC